MSYPTGLGPALVLYHSKDQGLNLFLFLYDPSGEVALTQ